MTVLDFANPTVEHPALHAFAAVAQEYCGVVEAFEAMASADLVRRLHALVPKVYAAGLLLPPTGVLFSDEEDVDEDAADAPSPPDPDDLGSEARLAMCQGLEVHLGAWNIYRQVFDPWERKEEGPEVTASLANDVTDIYGDLRCGLLKWGRNETGAALWEWRFGLEYHWGQHATAAIRALHCAAAWHESGWPTT